MTNRERLLNGLKPSSHGLPVFESEQKFQDYLEESFENNGYTAIQEVRPHRSSYKVDLLLIHPEYGKIGVELKWLTGGTDAAKAHKQIVRQYAGRKYLGDRVDKWAFAPYMPKLQWENQHLEDADNVNWGLTGFRRGKAEVLEHFFHSYGIGTINVHETPQVHIRYGNCRDYYIPAFDINGESLNSNPDLKAIEDRVERRLFGGEHE